MRMVKYEIYLPIKYNDGTDIEPEKFKQVEHDLITMFGAFTMSSLSAPFEGVWKYGNIEYRDKIIIFHVLTKKDRKVEKFFMSYKETLKERFQQIDVLITVQEIHTIKFCKERWKTRQLKRSGGLSKNLSRRSLRVSSEIRSLR